MGFNAPLPGNQATLNDEEELVNGHGLALRPVRDALKEVEEMLEKIKAKQEAKTGTVSDFCRLMQMRIDLQTQLDVENVREIKVTWLDPDDLNG